MEPPASLLLSDYTLPQGRPQYADVCTSEQISMEASPMMFTCG
jgi:hypothetical protein